MSRNPRGLPQLVYHGSPYRGIERFSADKIDTGEGNQAYGWGLYFADRKEVAEHYRKRLSGEGVDVGAKLLERVLADLCGDKAKARKALQQFDEMPLGMIRHFTTFDFKSNAEMVSARDRALALLEGAKNRNGQLYEVAIPDDGEMLMWDKSLSDQPEAVKKTLFENTPLGVAKAPWALTGAQLYRSMARGSVGFPAIDSDKAASQYFAALGIKGIKYLDGDSRDLGEGSFNYVIFDGADAEITNVFYSRAPSYRERAR